MAGCSLSQLGSDRESFKSVDALYTAVGLKDARLVDQSGERLAALHQAGKLPDDASRLLEGIIKQAREGQWEDAQLRLSHFMEGQKP